MDYTGAAHGKPGPRKKKTKRRTGVDLNDAKAEVWARSGGRCEKWLESKGRRCGVHLRWSRPDRVVLGTGSEEVEYHHVVLRSQGGEDTVDNYEACCPDCHRGVNGYHG